ncbi:MAG: SUF system NifU family Fe-S cluster assembly protein [Gemmatimonadota bacterium]|nr:SUF system NifU family Fe-S cluster assembly protein [Gemmatimonadota bacterium]
MSPSDRSAEISALYQEMILDHYRKPRNKGAVENADASIPMKNPLCGDEITLQVRFAGGAIEELGFTGRGCSISQASASMMTQLLTGKSIADVEVLRARFREMVMGDEAAADSSLGSLRALSGVAKFPARVKCALLPWNALASALELRRRKGT